MYFYLLDHTSLLNKLALAFLVYTIALRSLFIVTQAVAEQLKSGRVLSRKEFFVGI